MKPVKAVIVDDEPDSVKLLRFQLQTYCPQVEIAGTYTNALHSVKGIDLLQPDLVFLDIEMPGLNGFELLEQLGFRNFSLVFITAYSEFAVKAFRYNALDYLVKPIIVADLLNVIEKAQRTSRTLPEQLKLAEHQLKGHPVTRIAIPSITGITFIELAQIIYAEASNNYSILVLTANKRITVCKTLKDIQSVLEGHHFLRVHRQYIVNLNHVMHYDSSGNVLTLTNEYSVPVAKLQKERLISRYGRL